MRKSKFTAEQIAFALKQTETGASVNKVCKLLGVSIRTFYRWRSNFSDMVPAEINRLKKLEIENAKLKKVVADLCLDKSMLQDLLNQKLSDMTVSMEEWQRKV